MIRIEISGDTPAIIRAELQDLLRMYPSDLAEKFGVKTPVHVVDSGPVAAVLDMYKGLAEIDPLDMRKAPDPAALAKAVAAGEVVELTNVAGADDAPVATAEPAPKRGRGRLKKNTSAEVSADAQPAVASNTPAGQLPPAEGAESDATGATATVAAPVAIAPTNAQMRAALQEMVEAVGDQNAGQLLAKEILAAFQYQKVGQVQEEHTAGIIEKAKGAMERLTAEPDKASRLPIATAVTTELAAARS